MTGYRRLLGLAFLAMILPSLAFDAPDPGGASNAVRNTFNRMTDEERIGQLFMVTFQGKDISPASEIYQLVSSYHVGGILLKRENGNWKSGEGEAAAVLALSNGLQQIEAESSTADGGNEFIPLFLALPGGGDGYPNSQLITELTDVPSEMSIGATWQPSLARNVGEIIGKEFSLLGINMYLGPSLDVLESPHPGTTGDLGARTFGGDPFWVGKMGEAYIQGIQEGSQRKVAVIATHFPGIGASDRSPEEEVATIRKAMDDLKLIDLAPFSYVAAEPPGRFGITDGVMVSHIRYQGLQGNIRYSTRPISLDPQALSVLMALPEFTAWRVGGGITVSGSLGATSMRKFYESTGATFSNRHVALSAFQAGNDILQLADFSGTEEQSEVEAMIETIRYFQQSYADDREFAEKVNQAVLRILALKNRMYPSFTPALIQRPEFSLANLQAASTSTVASEVCKAGVTLISPDPAASGGAGIEPPTSADRIVVLTDSRAVVPCPSCPTESDIATTSLADTILRLYGPGASGLISPSRIQSYSFRDLQGYLQGVRLPDFEIALSNATVIVALIRTPSASVPESQAFQNLLAQRASLIRNKRIFVFALGAPYYLDSTEISKLDAYYGLYSKQPSCIEVAARVLLGDITPSGSSPVNIEGINYTLLTQLSPDPDQMILITAGQTGQPVSTTTPSPAVTETQTVSPTPMGFKLGDSITFTAGPVLDHNRHLVPDGTILTFEIAFPDQNIPTLRLDSKIANGMAQTEYVLDREGLMQVSAVSEPAKNSTIIQLMVGTQPGYIQTVEPTNSPESTPTVTATPTQPASGNGDGNAANRAGWDTLISLLLVLGAFSAAVAVLTHQPTLAAFRLRILLGCLVGGLAGYDLTAIGLAGRDGAAVWGGRWISVAAGMIGGILGAMLGWASVRWKKRKTSRGSTANGLK